jgi:hypothetical protein
MELVLESARFFSDGDERALFEWLERLPSVAHVRGEGTRILVELTEAGVTDSDLRELLALWHRYAGDMRQLRQLETPQNREWFRRPGSFWFTGVFE